MYQNIGKKIHLLAIILAALCAAGFLVAAVVFLLAALRAEGGSASRAAGFEGAGVFLVLAALSPLCSWVLYGFGSLVDAAERQAEAQKDVRDIVKKALSDGALSDEVARKLGNSLSKLTVAAAPASCGARKRKANGGGKTGNARADSAGGGSSDSGTGEKRVPRRACGPRSRKNAGETGNSIHRAKRRAGKARPRPHDGGGYRQPDQTAAFGYHILKIRTKLSDNNRPKVFAAALRRGE